MERKFEGNLASRVQSFKFRKSVEIPATLIPGQLLPPQTPIACVIKSLHGTLQRAAAWDLTKQMESPIASELTMVATILALTATSKLFLIGLPVLVAVEMLEEIFV